MTSLVNASELERQIAAEESVVTEAEKNLETSQRRLKSLKLIQMNVLLLERDGIAGSEQQEPGSDLVSVVSASGKLLFTYPAPPTPKKNIRSTTIVADLVARRDTWSSRPEIHESFDTLGMIPPTWENPTNAINNAISRAVGKGLIVEHGGLYASPEVARRSPLSDREATRG